MSISPISPAANSNPVKPAEVSDRELRAKFTEATAGLFYGELLKSLRASVGKPAYIHGGQAEELFQAQLDQQIVQRLATKDGGGLVEDLYQQFRAQLGLAGETSSLQPSESRRLVELTDAVRQAQPVAEASRGAFGTEGLTGLLRK